MQTIKAMKTGCNPRVNLTCVGFELGSTRTISKFLVMPYFEFDRF